MRGVELYMICYSTCIICVFALFIATCTECLDIHMYSTSAVVNIVQISNSRCFRDKIMPACACALMFLQCCCIPFHSCALL